MSDEKLDLIIKQNEEILANQNAAMGGAPPPDTSGEAWTTDRVGNKIRNKDWAGDENLPNGWNAELWDTSGAENIKNVDIAGIPKRKLDTLTGIYNTQFANYSYDVLIIPRQDLGCYIRDIGSHVVRFIDNKPISKGSTKHAVLECVKLATGGKMCPPGGGDIWVLQTSEEPNCGSVFDADPYRNV